MPSPVNMALWALAILIEVSLIAIGRRGWMQMITSSFGVEHLAERLGLFVIIVLGESVLTIVSEVSAEWDEPSGVAGALGFVIVALLAWAFFQYGTGTMERGLKHLQKTANYSGLRDTVMFLPFFLVLGITAIAGGIATAIAGGIATAIEHPEEHLPFGAAITLGGGIALFYATNAVIALRYGQSIGTVVVWAAPAVLLALLVIPLAGALSATGSLVAAAVVLALITSFVELRRRAH